MREMNHDEELDLQFALKDLDKAVACLCPEYAEKVRLLAISEVSDESFNDELILLLAAQLADPDCQFATDAIREALYEEDETGE